MENKPSTFTLCLGYGAIIALAIIVYNLILFLLNLGQNTALNYVAYVILLGGILLAQFNYRNKYMGGFISYGNAFNIGFITSIVLGVIIGIYTFVFFKYIAPGAMEEGMAIAEQKMMDRGMSDAEVEQGMAVARKFAGPGMASVIAVFSNIFLGLIISLLTALAVKKEDTGFGQPVA